jgi:hypothetical protein
MMTLRFCRNDRLLPPLTAATQGSVVMLTLAFLLAMTLQILLLGTVVNRTLGTSAVSSTQSVAAKEAADTGLERLHQALLTYAQTTTPVAATILTAYGSGGPSALANVAITVTNPETGSSTATPVTFSAYVAQARGTMYELVSTATYRDVQQTSRKWVQLDKCQYAAISSAPAVLSSNAGSANGFVFVDDMNNRAIVSDTGSRTLLFRDNTLLTTLLSDQVYKFFLDRTSGRIFFENTAGTSIYQLNTDNSLISIPSIASNTSSHGNFVVNPTTGELFTYRDSGVANQKGLWKYNPSTAVATQLVTFDVSVGSYYPNLRLNPNDGRIFMAGDYHNSSTSHPVFTWAASTGLTTLPSAVYPVNSFALNTNDSRIFYGSFYNSVTGAGTAKFYTWAPSTGLSTLISGCDDFTGTSVDISRNRVYTNCVSWSSSGNVVYSWDPVIGLSTISTAIPTGYHMTKHSVIDAPSGRYFFSNDARDIIQYNPVDGTLSTLPQGIFAGTTGPNIIPFNRHPLLNSSTAHLNNYRYNLEYTDNSLPTVSGVSGFLVGGQQWTFLWKPSTGITTIVTTQPSVKYPGFFYGNMTADPVTGNAYINADDTTSYFYNNATGNVVTLPATGRFSLNLSYGGHFKNVNFNTGRIYMMKSATTGNVQTIYSAQVGSVGATCD